MTIGSKIVDLRKKKKMSQEKLADLLGISRQTLSNYENDITSPDLNQAKKICEIFDASLDELIGNDLTISSKISSTERLIKKQNKNVRIILITMYFIIMAILISFTIHILTKKDFTKEYQMEFTCSNKENTITLSIENLDFHTDEHEFINSEFDGVSRNFAIIISTSSDGANYTEEKNYAGASIGEAINSLLIVKKALIDNGYKCY